MAEPTNEMSHQAMGYDRTSIMFSPDGRLLQVEYAKKTVKQGTTAVGVVCKDGVLLVADKRIVDKLIYLYGKEEALKAAKKLQKLIEHAKKTIKKDKRKLWDEKDVALITYPDAFILFTR